MLTGDIQSIRMFSWLDVFRSLVIKTKKTDWIFINQSFGRGSWRIRTAVHGFADRWLSHSSKEPFSLLSWHLLFSNALQRYNLFLNLQYIPPVFMKFLHVFSKNALYCGHVHRWFAPVCSPRRRTGIANEHKWISRLTYVKRPTYLCEMPDSLMFIKTHTWFAKPIHVVETSHCGVSLSAR